MKQKSFLAISAAFSIAAFTCESSSAAVFQWDGDTSSPGAQDGGGTWNAGNANWLNGTNVAWADANSATFGAGVDGTYAVGVELDPTVTSIVFNHSGYTLSAAIPQIVTATTAASTASASAIVVASGKTATIGSNVTLATPLVNQNSYLTGGGTLVINDGGTLKQGGTQSVNILYLNSSTIEVKTGGTLATSTIAGGNGTAFFVNGNLNVTGGTVSVLGTMGLGQTNGGSTGTLNIESGSNVTANSSNGIRIGSGNASPTTPGGTINLNGGTLTALKIWKGSSGVGTAILNLNGGTLKPVTGGDLIYYLQRANVRDNGVTIDTSGFGTTISQALLHSNIPEDAAIDGGLIKEGGGTLLLSGANDFNGGTTINVGAVEFGTGALPASGLITINSAGCLKVSTAAVPGAVMTATSILNSDLVDPESTGAIAFTENTSENVDLSGYPSLMLGARANTIFSGVITTSGDTYHLGGGGAILKLNAANALTGTKNLVIGAPGAAGNVAITNSNDISGTVTINSGSLTLGDLTSDGLLPNVTGVVNNTNLIFDVFGSVTPPPAISGPGTVRKMGNGTLTMSTANTYTGGTTLEFGILALTNPAALGSSTVVNTGNGQLRLIGGITLTNPLRCNGVGLNAFDGTLKSESGDNTVTDFGFSGVSGTRLNLAAGTSLAIPNDFAPENPSNVRVFGSGTLILGGDNSAALDSGHTFYLGLSDGSNPGPTVKAGNNAAFGGEIISFEPNSNSTLQSTDATARTFPNAVVLRAYQSTLGAPSTGDLTFAGGAITLGASVNLAIANNRTTFTGPFGQSGEHSLTKSGPGTLELAGSTSLTGLITVSGGTLLANASVSSAVGILVSADATLGGGGSVGSAITVEEFGSIAPGNSAGTLAALGPVAIGGSLEIQIDGTSADRLDVTGDLDITNAILDVSTLGGGATQPSYVIATFGSLTGSAFTSVIGLPSGYTVSYDLTNKQIKLVSGAPSSAFTIWINANYPLLSDKTAGGDPDHDGKSNLMEYAFGTDPSVSSAGSIAYVAGGNVITPGQPLAVDFDAGSGLDFRAIFGRRKDYLTAGLTYTVQFTAGLDEWVNNTATPTLVTGAASSGDIDAVSVPFPATITTTNGTETPTFFRVAVSESP